jgi:hypothetical protein
MHHAVAPHDFAASTAAAPVALLYRHALESIFSMLPFADLRAVLRVSQSWLQAVRTMRGLDAAAGGRMTVSSDRLCMDGAALLPSTLARHIVDCKLSRTSTDWVQPLDATLAALPSLTRLRWPLRNSYDAVPYDVPLQLRWPHRLTYVSFAFRIPFRLSIAAALMQLNALLVSLSGHASLEVVSIECVFDRELPMGIALTPLLQLPRLHTLRIDQRAYRRMPTPPLSPEQLQVARRLPLRRLECLPESYDMVVHTHARLLCMPGPALQWTTLPSKLYLWLRKEGQHAISELVKLPCLTELHPTALDDPFMPDAVDRTLAVLPSLPTLRRPHIGGRALSLDQRPSHIDRGLLQLHALPRTLTALCLRMSGLQTAQLRRLLSLTPNLQVLALVHCCHFDSLSFVQPVARTLRTLRLLHCGPMPPLGHVLPQALLQSTYMSPVKFTFAQHCAR